MASKRKQKPEALVIVESPAKAKTINKYLGDRYLVKASMGHVRDLPAKDFGIDIAGGFSPTYEVVSGRKKVVSELSKLARDVNEIFLATDLDREGEAIAWHLVSALNAEHKSVRRVIFNEITETAIREAFERPHELDLDKVNAQQARRILDRIVGYELSPLLWRKIAKGLSAGRVQSVAVRLVVEREREIRAFVPMESWEVSAVLTPDSTSAAKLAAEWQKFLASADDAEKGRTLKEQTAWLSKRGAFRAALIELGGRPFKPERVGDARAAIEALGFNVEGVRETEWPEYAKHGLKRIALNGRFDPASAPPVSVTKIETRRALSRPAPPFTTSTLQQAAANQLRFSASRTMRVAQELYEGIDLGGSEGPIGLITYMRTDSVNLSKDSIEASRKLIRSKYGDKYVPGKANVFQSRKRAQEAHEAIRPTMPDHLPEGLKSKLSGDQFKLYDLIWRRFVACQMTPAEWDSTTVHASAKTSAGDAVFRASGRTLVFDGHYRVLGVPTTEEQTLPGMADRQALSTADVAARQVFTSPPPRYSEASLVKKMEAEGIGRPSTYAAIMQTIEQRGYVEQRDRRYYATSLGEVVTDKLVAHFPHIMDVKFTAFMEDELDKIEEAHKDWIGVLHEFYDPFHTALEEASKNMDAVRAEPSEHTCPDCGKPMVYRWAKNGRFLACSGYPECKHSCNVDSEGNPIRPKESDHACPACGRPMVVRKSRLGYFLGCSGYPECDKTIPCDEEGNAYKLVKEEELTDTCEACGSEMRVKRVRGRAFLACTAYPRCKQTKPIPAGVYVEKKPAPPPEEAGVKCEKCGRSMVIRVGSRGKFIACPGFPKCRNTHPIDKLEALRASQPATPGESAHESGSNGSTKASKSAPKKSTKRTAASSQSADANGEPPPGFAFTRTGRYVVETWPEGPLICPECGSEMQLKPGRWGPFFSCTNFPSCRMSANLRGAAKKRAEAETPTPARPKPIPTDIECEECGSKMVIRTGRTGQFLGCSNYPKCKATRPVPSELIGSTANGSSS